ncbi:MAG: GNAT family N-acetyltransferase, partial [Acidithiobacillales bacterium]
MAVFLPHPPLRPWASRDAQSLVRHANDYEVWRFLRDRFPHPYTRKDAKAWLSRQIGVSPPLDFAISLDGEAVGGIGLVPGTDVDRISAEVGYWLGRAAQGRGLATRALRSMTAYAFDALGLVRLFALPFDFNTASVRVLEKAGYTREGLLRDAAIKEGRVTNYSLYAMTRSDF